MLLPPKPQLGDDLAPFHKSEETLNLLALRRSTPAATLGGPGPSAEQLAALIEIAARVPDHRRVVPYRFIIFDGEARKAFGKTLAVVFQKNNPQADPNLIALEEGRFLRSPITIAVISSVDKQHRTPEWEQILTCGAACQNLLIATNAMGFAEQWLTEWYAYDADIAAAMGLKPSERVAGFILIGTAQENPKERPRVEAQTLVTNWQG